MIKRNKKFHYTPQYKSDTQIQFTKKKKHNSNFSLIIILITLFLLTYFIITYQV